MQAVENGTSHGNLLSSWKEIAAYLKCTVRSCIRWEKERGLPVHRSADSPGTRVYAFKPELDEWLSHGNRNAVGSLESGRQAGAKMRFLLGSAALVGLAAAAYLLTRPGLFRSAAPRHDRYRIVTSQPWGTGSLRTWEIAKAGTYANTWKIFTAPKNTVMHRTIASGDLDSDGRPELAAPTAFQRVTYKGEEKSVFYGIFINVYKSGVPDIWKTTFFSQGDLLWEASDYWRNEIVVENLDDDPAAEIVLKTATALGLLRFDPAAGEIRLTDQAYGFLKDKRLLLRSVAIAKGRPGSPKVLVVSANEWEPRTGAIDFAAGWLLFLERTDKGLALVNSVGVDAGLCDFSLRAGDLEGKGGKEVFSTALRKSGDGYEPFLIGWDLAGRRTVDMPLPGPKGPAPDGPVLAVKDITFDFGDDILVGLKPKRLLLYSRGAGALELKASQDLETPGAVINAFAFGDTDEDNYQEVVVAGGVRPADGAENIFYLDVLGYRTGAGQFFSKWRTTGGEKGEGAAAWVVAGRDLPRQ